MSDCVAEYIKFGFRANYLCPGCGEQIDSYYNWLSFLSITKQTKFNLIKCPLCMQDISVDFSNCDRPARDCCSTLKSYTSSIDGIGSMEIDNTFIVH